MKILIADKLSKVGIEWLESQGLGKAAVMEGIRRCASEGAIVAYVGSDQEFYTSMGFTERHTAACWLRRFDR